MLIQVMLMKNKVSVLQTVSDEEFIDDDSVIDENYILTNVTRNYDDVIDERTAFIEANTSYFDARHYFDSDEEEPTWHDFSNYKLKVKLFKQSLISPHGIENPDSFFYAILYAIRHKFTEKTDFLCNEDDLKQDVGIALSNDLFKIKSSLKLDGQDVLNFQNQCFEVNSILSEHNLFLRVFELKDRFRYLIKQNSEQKKTF